jgi:hypothetical protein
MVTTSWSRVSVSSPELRPPIEERSGAGGIPVRGSAVAQERHYHAGDGGPPFEVIVQTDRFGDAEIVQRVRSVGPAKVRPRSGLGTALTAGVNVAGDHGRTPPSSTAGRDRGLPAEPTYPAAERDGEEEIADPRECEEGDLNPQLSLENAKESRIGVGESGHLRASGYPRMIVALPQAAVPQW